MTPYSSDNRLSAYCIYSTLRIVFGASIFQLLLSEILWSLGDGGVPRLGARETGMAWERKGKDGSGWLMRRRDDGFLYIRM